MNSSTTPKINALIVDNEQAKLDTWVKNFRKAAGFEPRTAKSAAAAEEILRSEPVDLLVVDLFLSEESQQSEKLDCAEGLKLIQLCRQENGKSRIIAITSRVGETPEAGAACLSHGADDFISNQWQGTMAGPLLQQKLKIFLLVIEMGKKDSDAC